MDIQKQIETVQNLIEIAKEMRDYDEQDSTEIIEGEALLKHLEAEAEKLPIGVVSKLYLVQAVIADRVIEDKTFETREEAVLEIDILKKLYEKNPQVHIFSGELTDC